MIERQAHGAARELEKLQMVGIGAGLRARLVGAVGPADKETVVLVEQLAAQQGQPLPFDAVALQKKKCL